MFRLAIHHGVKVAVAILIICLIGIVAIFRVPVQMIPNMDVTEVSVLTTWPGATPHDVEKEILIEQEKYLRSIPGLERMTSEAGTGSAEIEMEFAPGTDLQEVLIRVNNALSQVPSYPENVDQPRIFTSSYSDNAFLYYAIQTLPGNPGNVDIIAMRDFIDDHVRTAIERTPGVSEVRVNGGAERQVRILVDPAKLAERGIGVLELREALRRRNVDVSGGDIDSGKRRYMLRTVGRFRSMEDIEQTVVAERDGVLIYLRDVGQAELGLGEVQRHSSFNGDPSIMLSVKRQAGANVITVMDNVTETVEELNEGVLRARGLRMILSSDDVRYVRDAVVLVKRNLILGSVLAAAVLFLFLRSFSSTLIGAMGIPVCTIAAFLGLLLTGRSINVISLAGIAFAIGMTLDNSIVVMENIHRHRRSGKGLFDAALAGVSEVWTAVLASTLTTVFVFIPIIFVREEAGQLYSDIAVAISSSILMSMVVAITVIPCAAARWLRVRDGATDPPAAGVQPRPSAFAPLHVLGERFHNVTMRAVACLLRGWGRRLVLIGAVLAAAFAVIIFLTPKAEYLPEGEEAKVFSFVSPPPGYNLDEVHAGSKAIDEYFVPHIDADPARFQRGETGVPALRTMFNITHPNRLVTIMTTVDPGHIDDLIEVIDRRFGSIPGMNVFSSRGSIFSGNLGGTRSIDLDIHGPELSAIYDVGLAAFRHARTVFREPQVRTAPSLVLGQPLLEVRPDWERAREFGIEPAELGYLVSAFSDGAYLDEFFLNDEKIDMYLHSMQGAMRKPQDLDHLLVYSTQGGVLPLSALARIEERVDTDVIRRVDSRRTVTLTIVPPRGIPLEAAVETVRKGLIEGLRAEGIIPPDVQVRIAGASDKLNATRRSMSGNFILAIVISFLLMVAIFSHWGFPFIIMLSVPLGISGGIIGLWLMNHLHYFLGVFGVPAINQPLDMLTMLGFLVVIGTVVNNPILIVDQSVRRIRQGGAPIDQAILETTATRLRPIMMTTITTIFGLAPLVFLPGAGTELYRGLGAIVLFGLFFSTLVTVFFIPCLLSSLLQAAETFARRRRANGVWLVRPAADK